MMLHNFAYSMAGHDKGSLYYIVAEDADYVSLCDGRLRTLDKPKRKKKKHIQIRYDMMELNSDAAIRKAIKEMRKDVKS